MEKMFLAVLLSVLSCTLLPAQNKADEPFRAYLFNKEYSVYMRINFYEQDISIPDQELFGPMAGYLSREGTSYCWLVVSAKAEGRKASLQMANDFGSEDLVAELTQVNDTLFVLKHVSGSTLKVPNKGKWMKLPHSLELVSRPMK